MQILVTYRDAEGMPRAWAVGLAKHFTAILRRARAELAAYLREHGGDRESFERHVQRW